MRTALRVPWDLPVRLVAPTASAWSEPTVRTVAVGYDLPGVGAVRATTVPVGGTTHLARIGPVATDREGDLDGTLEDVLATLVETDGGGAVPVLVDGTQFTRRVLAALIDVPCGARVTYAGLAAAARRPRAVRAVASAMARNRVPLVLPCHRVVPSSGGTGRYGWGDAVKVALLDVEAEAER